MIEPDASGGKLVGNRWRKMFSTGCQVRKLAVLATVFLSPMASDAKVIYVNAAKPVGGNGTTWGKSFAFLQDALEVAKTGDFLFLAKGTYYPDDGVPDGFGDREISFNFNGVKVYGGFNGTETTLGERDPVLNPTILSGEIWEVTPETKGYERYWSLHVAVLAGDTTLDGVTIQRGSANGEEAPYNQGGGVYVPAGLTLTLKNCMVLNNSSAESGGAVFGRVVASDCTFSDNFVNNEHLFSPSVTDVRPHNWLFSPDCAGGAIMGDVTAVNCKFLNNHVDVQCLDVGITSSATGGAIAGNTISATDCIFGDNHVSSVSYNFVRTGSDATSRGGAISGEVITATRCSFTNNQAVAEASTYESPDPKAIGHYLATVTAFGGAVAGKVNISNCAFDNNYTDASTPTFAPVPPATTPTNYGDEAYIRSAGSALYVEDASSAVNCTFTNNATDRLDGTLSRGFHPSFTRGSVYIAEGSVMPITHCTFMNSLNASFSGAAIACDGSVNIISNILWYDDTAVTGFNKEGLIYVGGRGRISNRLYPTPSTETINVVKGAFASVSTGLGGNIDFGEPPERTFVNKDPLFVDATNAIGVDGLWRTADDGLRLTELSPAIGLGKPLFLPKDPVDLDDDGNFAEVIPVDAAQYQRIQGSALDLGAYEFGNILHRPDISVEYPVNTDLVDGVSTVDFGTVVETGTKVFIIKNNGPANLNNLVITKSGTNSGDFSFTPAGSTTLAPGQSTTFTVTIKPTAEGPRYASIHIASNDPDESPFDFDVQGESLVSDIAVEQPLNTGLTDGGSTIDFGKVSVFSSFTKTFTVRNGGHGNLRILSIASSGTNATDFKASLPAEATVAPGDSTTFNVTFTPKAGGPRTASVIINSNDPDTESAFLIKLTGNGFASPEIAVFQPFSAELSDGGSKSFGSVKKGLVFTKTFTIKNIGSLTLKNIAVTQSGSGAFSVTAPTVSSLAPGAKTVFTVSFKPKSTGLQKATIKIASNDADESPFDILISGTGTASASSASFAAVTAASAPLADHDAASTVTASTNANGLKYLVLTVQKSADWATARHTVEVSPNLLDWFSGSNHTTTLIDSSSVLKVRDNTPIKDGAKRYIRLK